jgi:peptide/nickel transport system permease protein
LAWLVAVPLGVIAAVRRNTWIDKVSGLVAYFGLSIPSVFFALLMVLLAAYTGWFPIGDMRDVVNWDQMTMLERVLDILHHLALPVFVLSTISMASWMRQMRGSMVETLSQDYVRTAKAKGLSSGSVLFRHALRNAINPLVTLFGYSIAYVLNGSFLVEVVMNWPGMARLVVTALFNQDQPVVMGSVLMATILLVIGNTVADILLALTDPRIRLS